MEQNSDIPLTGKGFTIGVVFNLKTGESFKTADEEAEFDSIETINAIKNALCSNGYTVELLNANKDLPTQLSGKKIDLAFNIAEGKGGRAREAQIPAILSYYGIPFTGSDETTLCIALDKALTKRLLQASAIPTPRFVEVSRESRSGIESLTFPVIVKPNAEGSSKGIHDVSIAENLSQLNKLLDTELDAYGGTILTEEYIDGREFTVGLIGNGADAMAFSPMEMVFKKPTEGNYTVYSYNVKKNYTHFVDCVCPPIMSEDKQNELKSLALKIYKLLQCRDFARADFRMDKNGTFHFIEINPLPGLAPNYSDFPMLAEFCGTDYNTLINKIAQTARKRIESEALS